MMYTNMDDYEDLSMDTIYPPDFSSMMPAAHRMKRERSFCAICGAKATGINFDVLTVSCLCQNSFAMIKHVCDFQCSSCKAFFRRNGIKPLVRDEKRHESKTYFLFQQFLQDQFVCRMNGDCKVDERSRRKCTACRLKKCFAMGMIKERIRTVEQNERHRALVEENRRLKLRKFQEKEQQRMVRRTWQRDVH